MHVETIFEANSHFKIYKSLFDYHQNACFVLDLEGKFILFNDAAVKLTGYSKEDAILMSFIPLFIDDCKKDVSRYFDKVLQGNETGFKTTIQNKHGNKVEVSLSVFPLYLENLIVGVGCTAQDMNEINNLNLLLTAANERIDFLSFHDELTGLANKTLFGEKVDIAIKLYKNTHGNMLGIIYFDLDRFKLINDYLGHTIGDQLLKIIAQRIQSCIRKNDIAARQGNDEFTILLDNVTKHEVDIIAQRLADQISEPIIIGGQEVFLTPSIGISLYPEDGQNANDLIRKADMAMYHAKEEGRNNIQFYQANLEKNNSERIKLEHELRKAIEKNEFILHYQPIIDLSTNKINGLEALIRWEHPHQGLVPPDKFIPIAEETGLIIPIGEMVLRKACYQMKKWHESKIFLPTISVNISIRQFFQPNLVSMISQIIKETNIEPNRLTIEITESMTMDVEKALIILNDLKNLGVNISIDDFGTGYSSLSYLKKFPIDNLKIDRSFIGDIAESEEDENIATTILLLADKLGLSVIAEGVETSEQLRVLREHSCNEAQGFLFSKPLAEDELNQFLSHFPENLLDDRG
ncbi:signaling protein [Neobacillus vireti LMG 21834]|uniref:Signaling protein n=1 Tax=Neobacillus vireti LMG 21834 TaxID=1131730 RepID=A0AB94IQJ5_9BACI|nr:signaling protein [Neobacillus vireti LMG 21834]